MITEILKANQTKEAVTLLQKGEIVAIPTETVYGLAADATNDEALRKIFTAKNNHKQVVYRFVNKTAVLIIQLYIFYLNLVFN